MTPSEVLLLPPTPVEGWHLKMSGLGSSHTPSGYLTAGVWGRNILPDTAMAGRCRGVMEESQCGKSPTPMRES